MSPTSPRVVVCVGDSITRGQVSSNYVKRLQRQWGPKGFTLVNAGVNGDLAYNVAARLDDVIARRPDLVTLLVGTNDVNSQFNDAWRARYRKDQKLPADPTRDWYGQHIDQILARLRDETTAHIAVLDIPLLGEDLTSRMNHLVDDYNTTLHDIAGRHGASCLPLHDRLVTQLPTGHIPPPYTGDVKIVMKAAARHMLVRQSWNTISRRNRLALLTDHIHFNDTAAITVASLIGDILQEQPT